MIHRLKIGRKAAARHSIEIYVDRIEQLFNVCQTTIARDAWERGQELVVHGWIYGLQDGLLRDLNTSVTDFHEALTVYHAAISALS